MLIECLRSIKKASQNLNSKIFVVDNNSSDGTRQAIEKIFPWVNLVINSRNLGFAKANNQVLKKARSKYTLILNPDTKLMPDTLRKMVSYMDSHQEVAVSTCRVELPNGYLDRDCRRHFPTPWRSFCHFTGLSKIFKGSKIFDGYYMGYVSENIEHEVDSCVGAFMMVRTSAVKKVGYFDEDFFFYGEDLDWCWRFKEAGFKIFYTPITRIVHYKGVASGIKPISKHLTKATKDSKKRAIQESIRAMELFYRKHYIGGYPFFLTWIVLLTIKSIGQFRLMRT